MKQSWREMIGDALESRGETWEDVVSHTLRPHEFDLSFDIEFGSPEHPPFRLWTDNWVYFSHEYDGFVSVESVARHPESLHEIDYVG
jgi:hypothetical protein